MRPALQQLPLFASPPVSGSGLAALSPLVSGHGIACLGMRLPTDFCRVSAPVQVVSRALCLPASAARLSVCCFQDNAGLPSAHACSGGVWLWAFQDPATAHAAPWTLCSSHEQLVCHCRQCDTPTSPYSRQCARCAAQEYEEGTLC
jgi:hypothetical protein